MTLLRAGNPAGAAEASDEIDIADSEAVKHEVAELDVVLRFWVPLEVEGASCGILILGNGSDVADHCHAGSRLRALFGSGVENGEADAGVGGGVLRVESEAAEEKYGAGLIIHGVARERAEGIAEGRFGMRRENAEPPGAEERFGFVAKIVRTDPTRDLHFGPGLLFSLHQAGTLDLLHLPTRHHRICVSPLCHLCRCCYAPADRPFRDFESGTIRRSNAPQTGTGESGAGARHRQRQQGSQASQDNGGAETGKFEFNVISFSKAAVSLTVTFGSAEELIVAIMALRKGPVSRNHGFAMLHMIGHAIFGLVIGLLARAVMPGRQHMGLILTMILGVVGAWLGGLIGRVTGMYEEGHPAGFLMALVGALVVLFIYSFVA